MKQLPRTYCGGTYDLFHAGHVNFFAQAAKHGDVIVAVNSDEFATRYKRKPVMSFDERLAVVQACRYVHWAFLNEGDEDSTVSINKWLPRYIAHGDDWTGPDLMRQLNVTDDFLAGIGCEMLYVPYTAGVSSTEIENRILERRVT